MDEKHVQIELSAVCTSMATRNSMTYIQNVSMLQAPVSIIDVCYRLGVGAIQLAEVYPQAQVIGLYLNPRVLRSGVRRRPCSVS